jgi:hypothetical protein
VDLEGPSIATILDSVVDEVFYFFDEWNQIIGLALVNNNSFFILNVQ